MPRLSALHHGIFRTPVQAFRWALSRSRISPHSFSAASVSELLAARPYYPAVGLRGRPRAWLPPCPRGPLPPPLSRCLRKAPLVEPGCANQAIELKNNQEPALCMLVRVCASRQNAGAAFTLHS